MNLAAIPTRDDLTSAVRLLTRLPPLLRQTFTQSEVHGLLQRDLANQEANFLQLARTAIFANINSPFRKLLAAANCDYSGLEGLVREKGLEKTLSELYRRGVYLTVDEAKGRRPVVRDNPGFYVAAGDLRNPRLKTDIAVRTGGSRGPGTLVPIDFASFRANSFDAFLDLETRGGLGWRHAFWLVPGSLVLTRFIRYTLCGAGIARWFTLVDPGAAGLHSRYAWSARLLRWAGLLARVRFPPPVHVEILNPMPIVQWMRDVLLAGEIPHLHSYVSCVVRLCQFALDHGISLKGAQFTMDGEPLTAARADTVRQVGAQATIRYASAEISIVGFGCASPAAPDEVHLMADRCAVIQARAESSADLPTDALLFTSLKPTARLVLLNVSMGDRGVLSQRDCGCALQRLGWTTHLHSIRSFEKLTAGGMTFLDADLVQVLDETLPKRFGGGPTDYQLTDEVAGDGAPLVRLLVHPRLGPLDAAEIRRSFLHAIGQGSGVERIMMSVWRDAGMPVVERAAPKVTAGGKILHVHMTYPGAVPTLAGKTVGR